jgi:hypothetical protein
LEFLDIRGKLDDHESNIHPQLYTCPLSSA